MINHYIEVLFKFGALSLLFLESVLDNKKETYI